MKIFYLRNGISLTRWRLHLYICVGNNDGKKAPERGKFNAGFSTTFMFQLNC